MFNKNDPLIDSVTKVMQENQAIRDAENAVNEAYGITDKRQLPFNLHSEYDALVQEALKGNQHKIDVSSPGNPGKPDGKLTGHDFKMLRGMKKKPMEEGKMKDIATDKAEKERLAQMKKMEEEALDEISADKVAAAARVAGFRADYAGDNNQHKLARALGQQSDRLWTASEKKRETENRRKEMAAMSSGKRAKMNKEEALDEISKKLAGKYTKAAADDLADKTDPNYSYMTDKDEDQVERETENRRKGIQRAVKTMMKDKAIKEERGKKVASAILAKMRAKAGKLDEFIAGAPTSAADQAAQYKKVMATPPPKNTTNVLSPAQRVPPKPGFNPLTSTSVNATGNVGAGATPPAPRPAPRPDVGQSQRFRPAPAKNAMASMATGRAAERGVAPPPKTTTPPPATSTKPAAPARTIQGPAGTTATMTGRGNDAIVRTKSGTYAGSVVKGLGGGAKIQNFRAGGGTPMGPKGK